MDMPLSRLKKMQPVLGERLYFHPVREELAVIGIFTAFHPKYGYEQANTQMFKRLGWKFIGYV